MLCVVNKSPVVLDYPRADCKGGSRTRSVESDVLVLQERNNASTLDRFKTDFKTAYDAKDFRKALFCLDRALAIASACRQLKIARAECLAFLGRYEESQEVSLIIKHIYSYEIQRGC